MVSTDASSSRGAHGAFPTALSYGAHAEAAQGSSGSNNAQLPQTPEQLWSLITSVPAASVYSALLPVCHGLTDGPIVPPAGKNPRFNPILALPGVDLPIDNAAVRSMTLGLTFVVTARLNLPGVGKNPEALLDYACRLATVGDPVQFDMVAGRVGEFAWSLLRFAQKYNQTGLVVEPLNALFTNTYRLPYFNAVHAVLLEACLLTNSLQYGYHSLEVTYIDAREDTTYLDVLTFHHHAGTIAAAIGDYERATEFFSFATAMPTVAPSAIQLACAKRAVLCEVLFSGKEHRLPRDVAGSVSRLLSKAMPDYAKLAKAFEAHSWDAVREAATSGETVFVADCNWGLVVQIVNSITKRRILTLRKTYSRLTLADLAGKVGSNDVAAVKSTVEDMIKANEIRATLSSAPEIVTFLDDDDYASPARMATLKRAQQKANWLQYDLTRANLNMGLNKMWLQKQARLIESKEKGAEEKRGMFNFSEDIGMPVRGVGSNLNDMGF